jgi:hypothetical protein
MVDDFGRGICESNTSRGLYEWLTRPIRPADDVDGIDGHYRGKLANGNGEGEVLNSSGDVYDAFNGPWIYRKIHGSWVRVRNPNFRNETPPPRSWSVY